MPRLHNDVSAPMMIEDDNLSVAWARALARSLMPHSSAQPLAVSVLADGSGLPVEHASIRSALDRALFEENCVSIADTAGTIFPYAMWERHGRPEREWLFDRYLRILPRIRRRDPRNLYGTYFARMVTASGERRNEVSTINQLDHILGLWSHGQAIGRRPRRSALQVSCFDPIKDHTGQPQRGFPCLQQISFGYDDAGGLTITAFYPTQYVFDRAYGNYLGLFHLGQFMAHEMGLTLLRMTCLSGAAEHSGKTSKKRLSQLLSTLRSSLDDVKAAQGATQRSDTQQRDALS